MSKLFSLIRASFSENMEIANYNLKSRAKLSPVLIVALLVFAVGYYAYTFLVPLQAIGQPEAILALTVVLISMLLLFEGIYKSQGMLFESHDNDLLFSLPIPRRYILFLRLFKFLAFEFIYSAVFFLPVCVVYAVLVQPGASFYFAALLYLFFLPIIPTVIASLLGYLVKLISSRFRHKRPIQIIFTLLAAVALFGIVFVIASGGDSDPATMMSSLSATVSKSYYPAAAFVNLVTDFNLSTFLIVLALNLLPLLAFIYLGSIFYFRIIARSGEHSSSTSHKRATISSHRASYALIGRELSRFFSSTVFIFNASSGIIMMLLATVALCLNHSNFVAMPATEGSELSLLSLIPSAFCLLIIFTGAMSCITSSLISLEGKSFNLTRSLPVSARDLFLAKIRASDIIVIPVILLCDIAFCIIYAPSLVEILLIFAFSFLVPTANAILGLIINLRWPKLKFQNDTEVIKQSFSSFVSVFTGLAFGLATILCAVPFIEHLTLYLIGLVLAFALICLLLWRILSTYGTRRWQSLDIS